MTTREYAPGTVALIRVSADYEPEIGVRGVSQWYVAGPRLGSRHGWYEVEVIRPLVVIDPEDSEQINQLANVVTDVLIGKPGGGCMRPDTLQAALREFTNPTPAEPTGLGASVEASAYTDEVRYFVRVAGSGSPWYDDSGNGHDWSELSVVRVLSEGWSE